MRVANKYMLQDNLRILIVSKGSEVIPALEKLKIPMFYFDKYGNPTEKPAMKKAVPAGVTAKTVVDNYIKAIGGEKAVKAVKTISFVGEAKHPQAPMPIAYVMKIDSKGKFMDEISMAGMGSLVKQVVNGNTAYVSQQGQKMPIEGDDLAKMKETAMPFSETLLATKAGVKVDAIEPINGSDAYAVVDGDTTHYFDVASGLKVSQVMSVEQQGQKMSLSTSFGDYKEVKGVKVPFSITKNLGFELGIKVSDVKINEGVTDADFQ